MKRGRPPKTTAETVAPTTQSDTPAIKDDAAQAYAMRIWVGQSRDLPRSERVRRCEAGVLAQGMSIDGLEFPDA